MKLLSRELEDTQRRFANEPRHVAGVHRLQNIAHPVRLNPVRIKETLMPQRAEHRALPSHGRFHRRVIKDVASRDAEIRMRHVELGGITDECRHLVSLLERLLDQLPTRCAGGSDNQNPQPISPSA